MLLVSLHTASSNLLESLKNANCNRLKTNRLAKLTLGFVPRINVGECSSLS